jgi:hypothetical protein
MKYILINGFAVVIPLLLSCFAAEQSTLPRPNSPLQSNERELSEDAPLEETQIWLKEQIRTYARYKVKAGFPSRFNYSAYKVDSIGFEGCTLAYIDVITDSSLKGKPLSTHKSKIKVNLAVLDYLRVVLNRAGVSEFGNYTVDAYTTGNKFIVEHQYEFRSGSIVKRDNRPMGQISFVFTNEDKAKKVIWALSHAIKLCQAQKAY